MSDGGIDDPFRSEDEAAREREARRREREARRQTAGPEASDELSRRSLGDRVGEMLGTGGGAEGGSDSEPAAVERPAVPAPPRPSGAQAEVPAALMWRRRLFVTGGLLFAIAIVVLIAQQLGGDDEPVAAPAPELEVISVTVPEGLTRGQTAEVAKEAGLRGNYVKETRSFKGFNPRRYDAGDAPDLEGFLFPATYEVEKNAHARDLIERQLEAFEQQFGSVNTRRAESRNLTDYDVLIIASLIEEEVQVAEERRLVAAVIYNRLAAGMPLGIDATLRFELAKYDGQLTESELATDSPYNTRINAGLPPTPIASPGLASIEAAAKPANEDFLYFVIEPGTCGEHFFTADEGEFQAAAAEYQAALEEQGGSPTECP